MRAFIVFLSLLLLVGCATTTHVVMLDPTKQYAPETSVRIYLDPPSRPYIEIARLESKGLPGEAETDVLEDARTRAGRLGAHAIIILETTSFVQPSVVIEDPWPPQFPWYYDRWYGYRYWFHPPPFAFNAPERVLPGGQVYVIRSVAIRFDGEKDAPADVR